MFEEWGSLGNAMVLVASLLALYKASDWTINNSVKVADITGFGKTTVGFILVAFSTSLPELCVSIFAAIGQESIGVAIGNVLGSNIVNICLILGICFLIMTLKNSNNVKLLPAMAKEEIGSLYFGLFVASIIPLTLLYANSALYWICKPIHRNNPLGNLCVLHLSTVKNKKSERRRRFRRREAKTP